MTAPASNTAAAIIPDAMEDAGLLQDGGTISSSAYARAFRRLNDIINLEQTQGLKLWLDEDLEVPLTAGTSQYTLGPGGSVNMVRPTRVVQAYFIDYQAQSRRPIILLSWNDWLTLGSTTQQGTVNSIFVNKQATLLYINCWLVPDTTAALGELHLMIQRQVTNPISLTETMEFPIEWRMFLRWALAQQLATNQPQAVQQRCDAMTAMYREMLENWDVENTETRFSPDSAMMAQQASKFR